MDERIKELLKYFREYLLDTDSVSAGLLGTAKATYPMLVVNLGSESGNDMALALKRQLLKVWPPYRDTLLFLQAEGADEDIRFRDVESQEELSKKEVYESISKLFEENGYFKNYTRLLVFYLMDAANLGEKAELDACLDTVKTCGEIFAFPNQNSVLFLTLNERIGHEKQASRIRCELAESYFRSGKAREIVPCAYIVSNKNTIGSFMPGDSPYFDRIFTDIILLSNADDVYVSAGMLHSGVKTAGYTMREKPVDDISRAAVSCLLKKISDLQSAEDQDEDQLLGRNSDRLLHRLGIQDDGMFYMLEPYFRSMSSFLPKKEDVDAFPRKTCQDLDLYSLSARKIEEETFGAWGCYMKTIIDNVEKQIISGFQREGSFRDTYLAYLKNEFSRTELIWMSKNKEEIRGLLNREIHHSDGNVLDSLKEELSYGVYQNAGIKDEIVNTIIEAGRQAKSFMARWNEMVNTESIIVRQPEIVQFYNQKVQNYIDRNRERIGKEFRQISDMQSLQTFLFAEIRGLIKSDPIFRAPFEDELIERVNQKDPALALRAIADDLAGENVKIWLAPNGVALGDPQQMALLLKDTTKLYQALHRTLSDNQYYYYNTDVNECADALNIYELNEIQLMI